MHIDSEARSKLDSKSRRFIFIGYGKDEFGHRFWDDQNKKIIRSKDVVFNEKVMYKDKMGTESTQVKKTGYVELEEPSEIEDFRNKIILTNTVPQ